MFMKFSSFFDGGKVVFHRIKLQQIRRKKQQCGPGLFNQLLGCGRLLKWGIVHHHHMISLLDWTEEPLEPLIENLRVTRPLPQLCGLQGPIYLSR